MTLETRIPPPLVFVFMAGLMWMATQSTPVVLIEQPWRWILIGLLVAAGLLLDLSALRGFFRARTTVNPLQVNAATSLVTGGVYRLSRNPMYAGLALLLLAWCVYLSRPLALLGPVAFMLYITRFQIAPEERALRARFGAEFEAYAAKVRRWL